MQAANAEADALTRDAEIREQQAQDALVQAAQEEGNLRRQNRLLRSRQTVAAAANGVDPFSGSPLATVEDTEAIGEIDALRIRERGQAQGDQILAGAAVQRAAAKTTKRNGFLQAGTTLLTGASQTGSNFFSLRNAGAI
jgi:hypothetical protein